LGIPPDRAVGAQRVDHDQGVCPGDLDGAVGVGDELAGVPVDGQPLGDDERRGARSGVGDLLVQRPVLVGHRGGPPDRIGRHVRRRTGPAGTQPRHGPVRPVRLAAEVIPRTVRKLVGPARRGDLGPAVEAGERRQRTVQTVVAAAGHLRAAIVDELAVRMRRRVGRDLVVTVAGTQALLDVPLVLRVLDRGEFARPEASGGAQRWSVGGVLVGSGQICRPVVRPWVLASRYSSITIGIGRLEWTVTTPVRSMM
jgi:hypothetical protein